jgi:hypothetical protein
MATKKGIAPVAGIVLGLAAMLIIGIVFIAFFSSGSAHAERAYETGSKAAAEELPCFRAPSVSIPEATLLEPDKDKLAGPQDIKVAANASIDSACFEDLRVSWTFTEPDGRQSVVENDCSYPYTNCSAVNHT